MLPEIDGHGGGEGNKAVALYASDGILAHFIPIAPDVLACRRGGE